MVDARVDTIVGGGQLVSSSQVYTAAIAIAGEKIVAIGPEELLPPADNYIDASGKYVLPGLIDCHVHLDGHDDYALGSLAAAHAGLTTLIPFGTYNLEGDETYRPPSAAPRKRWNIQPSPTSPSILFCKTGPASCPDCPRQWRWESSPTKCL